MCHVFFVIMSGESLARLNSILDLNSTMEKAKFNDGKSILHYAALVIFDRGYWFRCVNLHNVIFIYFSDDRFLTFEELLFSFQGELQTGLRLITRGNVRYIIVSTLSLCSYSQVLFIQCFIDFASSYNYNACDT